MEKPDYNSPASYKSFLDSRNMAMQKKFGQNFMINGQCRQKIADYLEIKPGDLLWEIGPGLGCMTNEFLERGAVVKVFEIDRGFISCLKEFFEKEAKDGRFSVVEGDVLKNWQKEAETSSCNQILLCGNLPYNIAATFIADTITHNFVFRKCTFTVQKEVTQRMCAKAGTENYSAFSVLCQWLYKVTPGIVLGSGNFWPKPNVDSQSVILEPLENPLPCSDAKLFVKLVHALFASRRKTINNNIKGLLPQGVQASQIFEDAGLESNMRAEELTVEQFVTLSNVLDSYRR